MGITDAEKKQLDEQGCIVIPDVLSDEEIKVYRADILRLAEEEKQNGLARDPSNLGSRRQLSGEQKDSALWLKLVDAEEHEGERFNVYEECLKPFAA
jgi:hypothetical protein